MSKTREFEDFLVNKNDRIDNAAFELINALVDPTEYDEEETAFDWNMEHIGEVVDMVSTYLEEVGFKVCRPYYEGDDRTPCFKCESCTNEACEMRKKS